MRGLGGPWIRADVSEKKFLTSSRLEHGIIQPSQTSARKSNFVATTEKAGAVDAAGTCF
jgi:hypothetical protein